MDRLAQIEAFIRVAEGSSFSAAARSLRTTQPSISKAVADLERSLGTRLLHRTTRTLSLTEAGTAYYERAKRVLALLEEADAEASGGQDAVIGRLRVNTSAMLVRSLVVPALLAFRDRFPEVTIEITMDDRRIDPVEEATDVTVRVGALSDSTLQARRAGKAKLGIFGAPQYLARFGAAIEQVSDLSRLEFIRFADRQKSAAALFIRDETGREYHPEWTVGLTVSNGVVAKELALVGEGLAILPCFFVDEDARAGRLVQLLPATRLPTIEVNLLHSFSVDPPLRVRRFIDFAIERWRESGILEP